jgi:DNA polymerase-3 subunit epsilon
LANGNFKQYQCIGEWMTSLIDLRLLALDCQATGANPAKGHLLEIGWVPACVSRPQTAADAGLQSHLVSLPGGSGIPSAVRRITGISEQQLSAALPPSVVWQHLLAAADKITAAGHSALCPLVIHFARFETPFLQDLHRRHNPADPFPFQIICTHEIAIRLLPDLPRRGIRALAGYYGHCMPETKRSADHAAATALIWQKLVNRLESACGITKPEQLIDWLASTRPPVRSKRTYPMNPAHRLSLPEQPGVYRMRRGNGNLLYIGKAKSLKRRVNSYFRPKAPHAEHILEMLTQARQLDITRTGSALEAAILESDEIKRHSPPYNIALRRSRRSLVFCGRDLSRRAAIEDGKIAAGPLPDGKSSEALAALGRWLNNGMQWNERFDAGMGYAVLAQPAAYAPDVDCLRLGFDMFRRQHGPCAADQSPLRFLTALGARLWQERLAAATLAEALAEGPGSTEEADAPRDGSEDEFIWTPEAVNRSIERAVMHNAHLMRRARWFCLLSESTLAWEAAGGPQADKIMVVFENGRVNHRGELSMDEEPMTPAGFAKPFHERQKDMDLNTYDRLRVVTTEVRRIISEGRDIELRLKPEVTLKRQQLTKVLRWV